jgi:hypothetical protein
MSDPQVRRFPFWLTLSVLGNLVLVGLLAVTGMRIGEAIGQARLRLDAVRLLVVGNPDDE